jgi:hypothetical protein
MRQKSLTQLCSVFLSDLYCPNLYELTEAVVLNPEDMIIHTTLSTTMESFLILEKLKILEQLCMY